MTTLANFPIIGQLTNISWDGSSPNRQFDCVPTCLCAGCMYLNGVTQMDTKTYDPDRFLDAAYSEGYQGGTDAARYVDFCAGLDVHLFPLYGSAREQVAAAHLALAKGQPVILTILDPYVPVSRGWTHAMIAYQDSAEDITALDPYIAKSVTHSNAEWESLIRGTVLWIMERMDDMAITIDSPQVKDFFVEVDGSHWHCKNGYTVAHGVLAHYKATNGLLTLGLPRSNEVAVEQVNPPLFVKHAGKGITVQYFERGDLVYDPHHEIDSPPGAGDVYRAHLYETGAVGLDPRLWQANLEKLVQSLVK